VTVKVQSRMVPIPCLMSQIVFAGDF
jgi:hypothetical protein